MNTQDSSSKPEPINDENLDAINGGTAPSHKEISFCDLAEISDAPVKEKLKISPSGRLRK